MKKNVASQLIGAQMINAADGTAFTGTATVVITGDGGTQSASGGTGPTHEGNGYHSYIPTQAETNFGIIAFTFTGSGAIPVTVQVFTTFPQTVDNAAGIAAIPTTAMRGTDSAALASVATESRLAELDAANLPTDIAAIPTTAMRGTDSAALASVATEARLAELDAANLPTDISAIPTTMVGTNNAATSAKQDTMETSLGTVTKVGPTKTEMDDAHALLATLTKQDAIKAITDALTAEAAANLAKTMSDEGAISATASGTPTTTTIPASNLGSSVDDFYNGTVLIVLTGTLAGQRTDVTDYVGSTKVLTVTAMTSALSASDTFILL